MAPSKKRKHMTTPDAPSIRSPHHDRYRSPPPVGRSLRSRTLPVAAHTTFTPINAATTPPIAAAAAATPTADAATTPTAAAPRYPDCRRRRRRHCPDCRRPRYPNCRCRRHPEGLCLSKRRHYPRWDTQHCCSSECCPPSNHLASVPRPRKCSYCTHTKHDCEPVSYSPTFLGFADASRRFLISFVMSLAIFFRGALLCLLLLGCGSPAPALRLC